MPPDARAKWQAVAARVAEVAHGMGRPVLVGTRTVRSSEQIAALLASAGIAHVVLNAKQHSAEAEVIARVGQRGAVTVAANLAGRGTDIVLGDGVAALGGLHVILTEHHESARIDRQLFGRAARQGDLGSGEAIVALDGELFVVHAPQPARLLGRLLHGQALWPPSLHALLRRSAQWAAESRDRRLRGASVEHDRHLAAMLAFSGRG